MTTCNMKDKRIYRFELRLSEEEYSLFKRKSERYQNISSMVRDAVKDFNDIRTQGKIAALTEIKDFYIRFDQRLGWLGANVNQAQKRANELAIAGELSPTYIQQVLLPNVQECLKFIRQMKSGQDEIYDRLLKM